MNDAGDSRKHGLFRLRCADHDGKMACRLLIERDVHRSARGNIQRTFFDIINNADNSHARLRRIGVVDDLHADRILPWKILFRQSLIDDDNAGPGCIIAFRKISSTQQSRVQSRKVAGVYAPVTDFIVFPVKWFADHAELRRAIAIA